GASAFKGFFDMSTVVIIPARYQSSRFPGKPLAKVRGKSVIQRVWELGRAAMEVDHVYVATDHQEIADHAEGFGADVIMTSEHCRNGTERVAEAAETLSSPPEIIINLQGDAPLTPPWFITALADAMKNDPSVQMATPALACDEATYRHFREDRLAGRVGGTTVVFDRNGNALYFSKEVLPYIPEDRNVGARPPVFHHVGLYAYRWPLLKAYPTWESGPLEQLEQLEQLRVLENGHPIRMVQVDARNRTFWESNQAVDIARIEAILDEEGELI
ncbi:MAG: 3-deoxy-manno-octulosonate cytidylyltransferase, partial [Geminicoccaceae bacterium]